ncbi:hypothetical protein [Streptomyces sp. NPDC048309]|uniref:hypothetical protein n=1 Tax=Streptomyces sp. NPDC048309 TaxID=3154618 RepID=UPI0033EFB27C
MTNIRRRTTSGNSSPGPVRLPQRWAVILIAAAAVAGVAFLAAGPLAALGGLGTAVTVLHTVME